MSVDISHLAAHLSDAQRIAIQAEYERRAKSPTAAFLLCFFLGIFGAHRFYLGQPGAGVLRLILSPLLIPGIILEIVDLFRIDHEVYTRNLTLAEELIGANTLDAHSPAVVAAVAQVNAIRQAQQQTEQQTEQQPTSQTPAQPVDSAPAPTPSTIEATVVTPISGDPGTPTASTIEIHEDAPPIWPVDPEVAALTAAGAAGVAASASEPASRADSLDITPEMVAMAAATADAEAPLAQGQAPAIVPTDGIPIEAPAEIVPAEIAPTAGDVPLAAPAAPRRTDVTDRGLDDAAMFDLADLGEPTGKRVVVRLPEAAAAAVAGAAVDWTDATPTPTSAPEAVDALPAIASGTDEMPGDMPEYADSMARPLVEEAAPLLLLPLEPTAAPGALAAPEPVPASDVPDAVDAAEAPAPAAMAAAGDGYEADVSEELHDRLTDTGSHRIVKRVKVVRRLVINGQVVEEATAEQVVDADADTSATARNLQESLRSGDIQQRIAALSTPISPPPPAAADEAEAAADDAPIDPSTPPATDG